jgi:hypothetical protein
MCFDRNPANRPSGADSRPARKATNAPASTELSDVPLGAAENSSECMRKFSRAPRSRARQKLLPGNAAARSRIFLLRCASTRSGRRDFAGDGEGVSREGVSRLPLRPPSFILMVCLKAIDRSRSSYFSCPSALSNRTGVSARRSTDSVPA